MVAAMALLSAMDAMAKYLTMDGVTVIQIVALRSLVIVPILVSFFYFRGKLHELKPKNAKAHLGRGCIGFVAPVCFFLGITHVPLTDAVVIFFSSIFFVTLLSIIFLGEKVGIHRWASVLIGFGGVLIVVGPKGGGDLSGYLLILTGSLAYSVLFVSSRHLSATESVASMVLSYNVCVGGLGLFLLAWFWTDLDTTQLVRIFVLSLFALSGHYLITMAFAKAEASLLAPLEYTGVVWAVLFDVVIWQLIPTVSTFVGAVIIIGSGLYIVHREQQKSSG